MTDWTLARKLVASGELDALASALDAVDAAKGPWWLVQLATSDATRLAVVEHLLRAGASVGARDTMNNTALHLAVKSAAVLDRLLAAGAEVDAVNERGHTPLLFAADQGPPEAVARLLAAGANVNHAGTDGGTALLFACDQGRTQSVHLLLDAGARTDIADKKRRTPLGVARATLAEDHALLRRLGWTPRPPRPAPEHPPPSATATATRSMGPLESVVKDPGFLELVASVPASAREDLHAALTSAEFRTLDVRVYEGDVRLVGNLALEPAVHVFTGALEVDGAVFNPPEYSLLVVLGTLRATHLVDLCTTVVCGDLEARGLVFGESGSDRMLVVAGDLRARAVAEDGHAIIIHGALQASHVLSLHNVIESKDGQAAPFAGELDAILDERAVTDGHVDAGALQSLIAVGVDPLLDPA